MAQLALAVALAAGVSRVVWARVGNQLNVRTDIVGSTTFDAFDIYHYLDHLYILILLFPALAGAFYLLIARWGPLASAARLPWPPALVADRTPQQPDPAVPGAAWMRVARLAGLVACVALPALVVAVEVEVGRSPVSNSLDLASGTAAALAYMAAVAILALVLAGLVGPLRQARRAIALANGVLAAGVVPMLLLVSRTTTVFVISDQRVVRYPWLPGWLVVTATLLVLAVLAVPLARRGWAGSQQVQRWMLVGVVAPVALFLLSAVLQDAQGPFNGFDDAQGMVGARLMFEHGLMPWRDVFLLHGFLTDGLYGALGMWAFGATRWASNAGATFFVSPLTVIALYVFIAYFARRNWALLFAGSAALVFGLLRDWPQSRYVLVPLVLVLFDVVLRKGSWARCWAFMGLVVFTSIVTPESTILVLGVLATLVIAESVHRRRSTPVLESFRRSVRCAVAGAALTVVWIAFLVATRAFPGFVAYYTTTVSGHELWGAHSFHWPVAGDVGSTLEFALPIGLFLLTAGMVAWKIRHRSEWRTEQWVIVASATFVPMFAQVALDRFDAGHVIEFFQPCVPLVLLWVGEVSNLVDRMIVGVVGRARAARIGMPSWRALTPAALLTSVIVMVLSPGPVVATWENIPSRFHASSQEEPPTAVPLGYTVPGSVDIAQIEDLRAVIDRYAAPGAPVFEFTNEMGVPYFLLDRVPGARFYHVESAQTASAQKLEIDDLKQSRPPLVIFNDTSFGLPNYDGIWSMERNYLVSQYLLDNYQPIVDVQGQLIMLRNELVSTMPPLPQLSVPPRTTDLYFADIPTCDWGKVPNFLIPPGDDEIAAGIPAGTTPSGQVTTATGWAFDTGSSRPLQAVVAVSDGAIVARATTGGPRPDVVSFYPQPTAADSGWTLSASVPAAGGPVSFYTLNADGTAAPLPGGTAPATATAISDHGHTYPVTVRQAIGRIDLESTSSTFDLSVSPPAPLSHYRWLEFQSASGFGDAGISLTDQLAGGPAHVISFQTMPRSGHAVFLRVGSCIQWHGYDTAGLKLLATGAPADMTVRLLP